MQKIFLLSAIVLIGIVLFGCTQSSPNILQNNSSQIDCSQFASVPDCSYVPAQYQDACAKCKPSNATAPSINSTQNATQGPDCSQFASIPDCTYAPAQYQDACTKCKGSNGTAPQNSSIPPINATANQTAPSNMTAGANCSQFDSVPDCTYAPAQYQDACTKCKPSNATAPSVNSTQNATKGPDCSQFASVPDCSYVPAQYQSACRQCKAGTG